MLNLVASTSHDASSRRTPDSHEESEVLMRIEPQTGRDCYGTDPVCDLF